MINAYPFFRSICIVSLFLFLYFNSFAQNFPINGKIINAEGQPLAGVTIQVKGSNAKALTNPDGTFGINVPSSSSVLVQVMLALPNNKYLLTIKANSVLL